MKVTSLRYLDAKCHHPSLGASPPVAPYSICMPPELLQLLHKLQQKRVTLWLLIATSWIIHEPTDGWLSQPKTLVFLSKVFDLSTSWASCYSSHPRHRHRRPMILTIRGPSNSQYHCRRHVFICTIHTAQLNGFYRHWCDFIWMVSAVLTHPCRQPLYTKQGQVLAGEEL